MTLPATIVHIIQGTFWQEWTKAVFTGIGVIAGAQVGAWLSEKIKPKGIIRALAAALLFSGDTIIVFLRKTGKKFNYTLYQAPLSL
jgi:uncharacterized membrane protein YfcA